MGTIIDLTGQKFGKLTVLELANVKMSHAYWRCQCTCGGTCEVQSSRLKNNTTKSCGCLRGGRTAIHGDARKGNKTSEYMAWISMKHRCLNPKAQRWIYYGGRGIGVCRRWLGKLGYEKFLADLGRKPFSDYSLDRIDNNKGYTPTNCRWATHAQQMKNRRTYRE